MKVAAEGARVYAAERQPVREACVAVATVMCVRGVSVSLLSPRPGGGGEAGWGEGAS